MFLGVLYGLGLRRGIVANLMAARLYGRHLGETPSSGLQSGLRRLRAYAVGIVVLVAVGLGVAWPPELSHGLTLIGTGMPAFAWRLDRLPGRIRLRVASDCCLLHLLHQWQNPRTMQL